MPEGRRALGAARPRARARRRSQLSWSFLLLSALLVVRAGALCAAAAAASEAGACAAADGGKSCAAPSSSSTEASPGAPLAEQPKQSQQPLVCVVVRTYWAHGSHGDNGLPRLLHSLRAQTHANWRALLLVLDSRPFPDLHHLVADFNDSRVEVFAEWIAARYAARAPAAGGGNDSEDAGWAPTYHDALYNATDVAVRACPRDTEWLAVTNGDNEYDPEFLAAAVAAGSRDGGADVVAADYYTRYQRPTGPPCERFAAAANSTVAGKEAMGTKKADGAAAGKSGSAPTVVAPSPCKQNLLRWCQTDLAATMYYWPRFVEEDVRFWDAALPGDVAGSHDGRLAEALASKGIAALRRRKAAAVALAAAQAAAKAAGQDVASAIPAPPPPYVAVVPGEEQPWRAVRLSPNEQRCMVDHHPSPQRCAEEGGVWDDSRRATQGGTGGRCLTKAEAGLLLARDQGIDLGGGGGGSAAAAAPRLLELVEVNVTHDGRSFGRGGKQLPPLRCIRLRDREAWPREARFFGPKCDAVEEGGEGWTLGG